MGYHQNVGKDKFPKQGEWLGRETKVMFGFDSSTEMKGKIIRDDMEEPYLTLIQLEDGRVVRSAECQYSPLPEKEFRVIIYDGTFEGNSNYIHGIDEAIKFTERVTRQAVGNDLLRHLQEVKVGMAVIDGPTRTRFDRLK